MKHFFTSLGCFIVLLCSVKAKAVPTNFNPFPDSINVKGLTYTLDAGAGYTKYTWSSYDTTQTITANQTGWYKVTVTDVNGSYTDSVYVGLLNVVIAPRDSVLSLGQTLTLTIDTAKPKTIPVIYIPGSYNNWSPTTAFQASSITNSGYYEAYQYIPAGSYQFKFTSSPDWTHTVYGAGATAGTLSTNLSAGNINFKPTVSGVYKLGCNTTTLTYDIVLINSFSVVGDAAQGWGNDIPLSFDSTTNIWSGYVNLTTGHIKFRANNAWTINYGGLNTDSTLVPYGPDILIPSEGFYYVTLNFLNPKQFTYHLINITNPQLLYPTITWSTGETTTSIDANPMVTTHYTVTISNGINTYSDTVTLYIPAYLSGQTLSPKGILVPNVTVNLNGVGKLTSASVNTDSMGSYIIYGMTGDDYTFKFAKNYDQTKSNGVSSIDLALIQSHILAKTALNSPYKIIAADINGDGKVSAIDLVYMKRLILGLDTIFTNTKTGEKRLWTFISSDFAFADSANPFPYSDSLQVSNLNSISYYQTMLAIRLGDVNWDWNPLVLRAALKEMHKRDNHYHVEK